MGEKIEIEVDAATAETVKSLRREIGTLKHQIQERDERIRSLESEIAGWKSCRDVLEQLYRVMKYELDMDDGNERC